MTEFRSCAHTEHGLQVQQASGEWKDVTVPAGHVLVLPGSYLWSRQGHNPPGGK